MRCSKSKTQVVLTTTSGVGTAIQIVSLAYSRQPTFLLAQSRSPLLQPSFSMAYLSASAASSPLCWFEKVVRHHARYQEACTRDLRGDSTTGAWPMTSVKIAQLGGSGGESGRSLVVLSVYPAPPAQPPRGVSQLFLPLCHHHTEVPRRWAHLSWSASFTWLSDVVCACWSPLVQSIGDRSPREFVRF